MRSEEALRAFGVRSNEVLRTFGMRSEEVLSAFGMRSVLNNNIGTIAAGDGFFNSNSLQ
ncbi:MAG TPA: hypothetical protein VN824_05755 [Puia sp.]|nr:hypothetical protein [Puia sp.]